MKLLEGAEVEVPVGASSKNAMVPMVTVDTTNILFICGGAFPDLDQVIRERLAKNLRWALMQSLKITMIMRRIFSVMLRQRIT